MFVVYGLSINCCSNIRYSEMFCFLENILLLIVNNCGIINVKVFGLCVYFISMSVKVNVSLEKGNFGNFFCLEYLVLCIS